MSDLLFYKAGTAKVIQWLSETAQAESGPKIEEALRKVVLKVSDFLRLTREIVIKPTRRVPVEILSTLKDVISARKVRAAWFLGVEEDAGGTLQCSLAISTCSGIDAVKGTLISSDLCKECLSCCSL